MGYNDSENNYRKLSRKDKVYLKLQELTDKITLNDIKTRTYMGIDAQTICDEINVSRNNVCKELNNLFREKKVIKVLGKPVLYFDRISLENKFNITCEEQVYKSIQSLQFYITESINDNKQLIKDQIVLPNRNKIGLKQEIKASLAKEDSITTKNIKLAQIIGAEESLKEEIEYAKAAVLYPPNGLHMLITGATGVGKTTLAEALYRYAIGAGNLRTDAPFVVFNCADYSDNKQLLVSQLFGHQKGSFTGAEKDKQGLVDYANNGILFLDEVHRLSQEGQEMLFTLMDKGVFRRLGETENTRSGNVLFIMATTEDPNSAMLQTFLRRIPVIIKLPSLQDRTLKERISFIHKFFQEESKRIGLPIKVSKEVIKGFMLYECPGNIGQLKSDIQIICARAFLDYITFKRKQLEVKISQLSDRVRSGFFSLGEKRSELIQHFNLNVNEDIIYDGREIDDNLNESLVDSYNSENLYHAILNEWENMTKESLSDFQKREIIELRIENYFENIFHELNTNVPELAVDAITKIVPAKIVEAVRTAIENLEKIIEDPIDDRHIYGLSLHINNLIKRGNSEQLIHPNQDDIAKDYPTEFAIAKQLKTDIEQSMSVSISDSETPFLTMFLHAIQLRNTEKSVGILVIAHGKAAAGTMVEVANTLLGTDHAKAIDMPLEERVEVALLKAVEIVKQIDMGKGVLILIDMGSISSFSHIITEKTGIPTKTIEMVSTAMVIEATRKSLQPNINLDLLYSDIMTMKSGNGRNQELELDVNSPALENYDIYSYRNVLVNILDKILVFLNPQKTCYVLNATLDHILEELNKPIDNSLNTKFIFHCSCMLERVIRNNPYNYNNVRIIKKKNPKLFNIIKHNFQTVGENFAIQVPDTEIAYIFEIFETHLDIH